VTCTISRNGDLIQQMYLRVKLPSVTVTNAKKFRWLDWIGHILIKNVEIEIGGQRIDKHEISGLPPTYHSALECF